MPLLEEHSATSSVKKSSPTQQPHGLSNKTPVLEECDYDKTCTALYKAIEAKKWEFVIQLVEDAEDQSSDAEADDDNSSGDDGIIEHDNILSRPRPRREAAIWVVRKERDGRLRWRLLPLHAALIFNAPLPVVEILLRTFPEASTMKDDQGMLPLHLACRNAPVNFEVLEELLTAHPAAVYVKDRKGRTPIQGGLNATGSDKNPGLSAMELYTQILAAGEKQRWRTEHEHQTSQKLQLLASQQQTQVETLRKGYENEIASQKERFSITTGSLSAQLKATRVQLDQLKQEKEDLKKEYSSQSTSGISKDEYDKLAQTNRQLHGLVQILLDQHNSLQESLQTLQKDQASWHEERNALMRQYCTINEQAAATSQAHASIWQEELSTTEKQIRATLKKIPLARKEKTAPSPSTDNDTTSDTTKQPEKSNDTTSSRTKALGEQLLSESLESSSSSAAAAAPRPKEKKKGRTTTSKAKSLSSNARGSQVYATGEQDGAVSGDGGKETTKSTEPTTTKIPSEHKTGKFEEEKKDESLQRISVDDGRAVSVILSHSGAEILP
eukprot:CAMPEP_0168775842 /NCGR_PEP_ID=MMETSP0725-20121227/5725_1 /TAXON_ID=265536 /ORGANISM="Amphiprora sp., Strain CCMP467" /LENGTH=553 /DNA_ID=CAMNT_0008825493 /DNA_START=58 /DNA_END=1722 /DNA_ORIENTATION=-